MKIFVDVARLEIGQLFTKGARRGHPCTLDTFLVLSISSLSFVLSILSSFSSFHLFRGMIGMTCLL